MAKNEVIETGKTQAGIVVNNAFIDGLAMQLQDKMKYGMVFPDGYSVSNELMGAYLVLKDTKDRNQNCVLQSCSQQSIAKTLMDMATMGLSMQKKQCYPVAYGGTLQCQVSVYGNTCIARRYGLKEIPAMVIYADDEFEYHIYDAEIVIDKHVQNFKNIDFTKIVGAYAIAKMQDGTKHVELMNISMIKKAWAQGYGYKENGNGTHQKFTDQMAMKTVKNRCLKYIIRTHGTQEMSDYIDREENDNKPDVVAENVKADIIENANTEIFEPDVIEEITESDEPVKKEETENKNTEYEIPDFMKA